MSDSVQPADWDGVSFIRRSKHRQAVMAELIDGPAIPTEIADQTGLRSQHVSTTLSELRREGYMELLVDEETRKGRYYGLTDRGRHALDHLARTQFGVIDDE